MISTTWSSVTSAVRSLAQRPAMSHDCWCRTVKSTVIRILLNPVLILLCCSHARLVCRQALEASRVPPKASHVSHPSQACSKASRLGEAVLSASMKEWEPPVEGWDSWRHEDP